MGLRGRRGGWGGSPRVHHAGVGAGGGVGGGREGGGGRSMMKVGLLALLLALRVRLIVATLLPLSPPSLVAAVIAAHLVPHAAEELLVEHAAVAPGAAQLADHLSALRAVLLQHLQQVLGQVDGEAAGVGILGAQLGTGGADDGVDAVQTGEHLRSVGRLADEALHGVHHVLVVLSRGTADRERGGERREAGGMGQCVAAVGERGLLTRDCCTAISATFLIFEPEGALMEVRKPVNSASSAQLDDITADVAQTESAGASAGHRCRRTGRTERKRQRLQSGQVMRILRRCS